MSAAKGYGQNEAFTRGYDRGNYVNAYESQDWEAWYLRQPIPKTNDEAEGLLLGFYSSYEIHEISDDGHAEAVAEARAKWGDE